MESSSSHFRYDYSMLIARWQDMVIADGGLAEAFILKDFNNNCRTYSLIGAKATPRGVHSDETSQGETWIEWMVTCLLCQGAHRLFLCIFEERTRRWNLEDQW